MECKLILVLFVTLFVAQTLSEDGKCSAGKQEGDGPSEDCGCKTNRDKEAQKTNDDTDGGSAREDVNRVKPVDVEADFDRTNHMIFIG